MSVDRAPEAYVLGLLEDAAYPEPGGWRTEAGDYAEDLCHARVFASRIEAQAARLEGEVVVPICFLHGEFHPRAVCRDL